MPYKPRFAETGPSHRYQSFGSCIYCGERDGKLSDEHVIAYSLGGKMVLPQASCERCRVVTGKIEDFCTRNMMGNLREAMGLPTRRKKNRKEHIPLVSIRPDGYSQHHMVSVDEYPAAAIGFSLPSPGLMIGEEPHALLLGETVVHFDHERASNISNGKIFIGQINFGLFARMLAKVAHAYATAELGFLQFSVLPDFILGVTNTPCYFVGGDAEPREETPFLHEMELLRTKLGDRWFLFAVIRLFAVHNLPRYLVVLSYADGPEAPREFCGTSVREVDVTRSLRREHFITGKVS